MKLVPILFAVVSVGSCGGNSAPPPEPPRTVSEKKAKPEAHAAPRAPSGIECDEGSCFKCGDAVCFSGFYCAVGRSGRGCAWLPTCAGKPTCACLASALRDEPSCGCQEKEGGVYVVCDGAKL